MNIAPGTGARWSAAEEKRCPSPTMAGIKSVFVEDPAKQRFVAESQNPSMSNNDSLVTVIGGHPNGVYRTRRLLPSADDAFKETAAA